MSNILCGHCVTIAEDEVEEMSKEEILSNFADGTDFDTAVKNLFLGKVKAIVEKNDPVILQFVGGYMFYMCPEHYVNYQMGE